MNLTKLDDSSTEMEFQLELQNRFQLLVDETDSLLEQTTTTIKETADKILGAYTACPNKHCARRKLLIISKVNQARRSNLITF